MKPEDMNDPAERVSITIPRSVLAKFDSMLTQRGFANRSQAITEILNREIIEASADHDEQIMAGTITLFYSTRRNNLQSTLSRIQRKHLAEVISSLHVQLEDDHIMEVLVVQGPAHKLRSISNELITCKGVKTGKLNLSSTIMPPLHQK
ncbi:nickel-responsive transcriptional regulator NikR [Pelagicoccus sp. SDUM812002]|uniref:nickel-responsive transcriptional regulator NikR n=1 Tax=Pelagicoccus sp. SDUM812002 TaxID=3041266 RepID=UPI00280EB823|nr:nickel-responsive transcriptional regulator NikR [Pelagicoccus sp. SDUM812002]MDQ8185468.1 nickel-responsive transcriptional regulator NikR [Pelagicoccus sp. SDUM812002]